MVEYIEVTCLCRGGWRGVGMGHLSSDNNGLLDCIGQDPLVQNLNP